MYTLDIITERLANEILKVAEEVYKECEPLRYSYEARSLFEDMKNYLSGVEAPLSYVIDESQDHNQYARLLWLLLLCIGYETIFSIRQNHVKSWIVSPNFKILKQHPVLGELLSVGPADEISNEKLSEGLLNREGTIFCEALRLAYQGKKIMWKSIYENISTISVKNQAEYMRKLKLKYEEIDSVSQQGFILLFDKNSPLYTKRGVELLADGWQPTEAAKAIIQNTAPTTHDVGREDFSLNFSDSENYAINLQHLAIRAISK